MVGNKSRDYWRKRIQQSISEKNPSIDVEFGPVYDAVVNPTAVILEELSAELDNIKRIVDVSRWQEWSTDELDMIAANYGLTRRGGTKATGIVVFYTVTRPTIPVVIPRNTVVMTTDGIRFSVVTKMEVAVGAIASYKNVVTGRYEIPVHVEAIEIGSRSNVANGAITIIEGMRVAGVTNVINKVSTKGGSDGETNEGLIKRIQMLVQGGVGGTTINGLRLRLLQAFENEVESVAVEVDNPIIDGTVDIWFIGDKLVGEEERTYWFGRDVILNAAPVVDVTRVVSGGKEFVKNVDWQLIIDESSGWARTTKSRDRLRWISLNRPVFGAELTINYIRNSLLDRIEEWERKDYNRVTGMELRYREGKKKYVEVAATVVLFGGFSATLKSIVRDTIFTYINSRRLGEPVEISDLMFEAKRNPGIDNVMFTKLSFKGGVGVNDIKVNKSEYVRVMLEDITII